MNKAKVAIGFLGLILFSAIMINPANAVPVGLSPILRGDYPDFSQFFTDNTFTPTAGHSAWWGDPSADTCNMCGPTTAADAMFWLAAENPGSSKIQRLTQIKQGDTWVNASPGVVIEQIAVDIGPYQSWTPDGTPFPGTNPDSNYINGQKDFFKARNVRGLFDYVHVSTSTFVDFFDTLVDALLKEVAIELSNVGHWFAAAGARTDRFDDANGNGIFDAGDSWIEDFNADGDFDRYLFINNPWPGHASQGWQEYYESGGSFYLNGDDRRLDSVVLVSIPEPATIALLIIGFLIIVAMRLLSRARGQFRGTTFLAA